MALLHLIGVSGFSFSLCLSDRSSIARQYTAKIQELELKHSELARLNADYESKIHRKEV